MWIAGDTHAGQVRKNNQDAFFAQQKGESAVAVVCDGMGGEQGGAVASEIAIDTATALLMRDIIPEMTENSIRRVLECAGAAANLAVYDAACADISLKGMGTTMVGAVLHGNCAHIIHAGDSRAYLLRDDMLMQLTVDHTVVQMLMDKGEISSDDAKNHPQRHFITRAVGVGENIRYDIFSIDLKANDSILLCSDGLYNCLKQDELTALTAIAIKTKNVKVLIDRANQNGGGDNITAVIVSLEG